MKKLLLIILLPILSGMQAQNIPFIQEDKIWTVNAGDFFEDTFFTESFRFNGTTIINEIEYAIMEIAIGTSTEYTFFGHFREDNGQVYRRTDDTEKLYYDFNLNVGDTFESEIGETFTVTETNTMDYAGMSRKVIIFGEAQVFECGGFEMGEVWIEGIGSLTGFFEQFFNFDLVSCIACYSEDGVNFFDPFTQTFSTNDCRIATLGVDDLSVIKTKLYPNPIKEQAILRIDASQTIKSIRFYNQIGQFIFEQKPIGNQILIKSTDFPATGMYFYQIEQNGVIIDIQKFIVK